MYLLTHLLTYSITFTILDQLAAEHRVPTPCLKKDDCYVFK